MRGRLVVSPSTTTSTLILLVVGIAAFGYVPARRFTEIDVERINVIEPDGRTALVIANSERLPGAIWRGEELRGRSGSASGIVRST